MPNPLERRTYIAALILLGMAIMLLLRAIVLSQGSWENPLSLFGTRDLLAFWSGTQAFLSGLNPYQGNSLLIIQQQVFPDYRQAEVFLNPPWALPLFSVFFFASFEVTQWTWLALNISFLFLSAKILRDMSEPAVSLRIPILGVFLFMPVVMTLWLGQLTCLVLFSVLWGVSLLQKEKDFLAGFALLPSLFKPHLCFLLLFPLCFSLLRRSRFKFFLGSSLAFLSSVGLALWTEPNIFQHWLQLEFQPLHYQSSTLTAFIRGLFLKQTGALPFWPVVALPLLALAGVFFILPSSHELENHPVHAFTLLGFSLIFSPYGWFYDFTLLVPLQVLLLMHASTGKVSSRMFMGTVSGLVFLQGIVILINSSSNNLGDLFWFPVVFLLGVSFLWRRLL